MGSGAGSIYDNVYDVLFQPRTAMRRIAESRTIGQAFVVFLVSALIPTWAVYFGLEAAGIPKAIDIIILVQVLGSLIIWLVGAAVWHMIAEFLGGKGTALGLLAALGFAHFPRIFIVPLWVVAAIMPPGLKPFLMALAGLVVMFWTLALDVAAIREAHGISGAKAVLVLLTPMLAVVVLAVVIVSLVSTVIARWPLLGS